MGELEVNLLVNFKEYEEGLLKQNRDTFFCEVI